MRGAVIDLGTNTFNLLIYEKKNSGYTICYTERQPAAIGEGGMHQNIITPVAFDRGITTLTYFREKCNSYNVKEIKAFGTSALRGANNSPQFVEEVRHKTGIEIHIITGEKEAEFIYEGVKHVHDFSEPSCIMDIGGGSSEFIVADKNGLIELKSFNIGVARMIQMFELDDPLSPQNINQLEDFLEKTTQPFFETTSCTTLIGASGSFDTYYELLFDTTYSDAWKSSLLPIDQLLKMLDQLIESSLAERAKNPKILDLRQNMIHIAALKTRWVLRKLGIKKVWVSPASLKEGVMFSKFDSL